MFSLLRLISLRHMLGSPLRTTLTLLGVAVGVATMVGVTSINRAVVKAFRSTVDTIAGKADLTVAASAAGFDDSVLEQVRAVEGVGHASAGLTAIAPVAGAPGSSLFVMGVDMLDDGHFRTYEGADRDLGSLADDLELLNSTDRLLVSERFAQEQHLHAGSTFQLLTPSGAKPFVVHALIKETGPVKAFGGSFAVMYLGSAQEAFGRGRNVDRVDLALAPGASLDTVKERLEKALGPTFEVERPARRGGSVEKMMRSFQMGLNLGSGVALLVGVFLVYNTVAIGVIQRRREIGTLRALGGTKRRIRAMFTLEALVLGGLGTVVGLPLGAVVAQAAVETVSRTMSSLYIHVNARDVEVGAVEIALGAALGIFGSMFAALRPAVMASSVQPVEALRKDIAAGAHLRSVNRVSTVLGFLMLVTMYPLALIPPPLENLPVGGYLSVFWTLMAASLLAPLVLRGLHHLFRRPGAWVLGIPGQMAADNFARAPGRTAVPVSALAVGVAMTVCIGGFVHSFQTSSQQWINQSVPADLFITSSAKVAGVQNVPMQPGLGDELEKLPGVRAVDRIRVFPHDLLGLRIYIVSLDPEIYYKRGKPNILEGRPPTMDERKQGWVTISENLMRRRNLHVGSTFDMNTPSGVRRYQVSAVITDYTSDQGTVFMDRASFVSAFKDQRVDTFELYLHELSKLHQLRRTITERYGEKYNLYVLSNAELRAEAMNLIDGAFAVTYAMELVAVLLALLGVINTLLAAVLDRTREIGLLRAVGAARSHVLQLFVAEAAFIGFAGSLIGIAAGTVMGITVTKVVGGQATGWTFPYLFPTALALQVSLGASLCAIVAGLYPARRASRLDVVEALAYE
ncbi:MAG: ABC transporter permease [Myxococcaceae bacterium]